MRPSCWPSYLSLALFAVFGASSPVPDILPGLPPQSVPVDRGVDLGNIYYIQYKFGPTGETATIFTIKGLNKPASQSAKDPHTWIGSDSNPVCLLFCADPGADINIRTQYCLGPCREPQILPNIIYVTNTAVTGIPGSQLIYCPDQATGRICSATPPYPVVDYRG
ncbi:hypothetical protein MMC22_008535 [Lobaria immixta]|nr:hypothetical protein [Lobaria immixta]